MCSEKRIVGVITELTLTFLERASQSLDLPSLWPQEEAGQTGFFAQ